MLHVGVALRGSPSKGRLILFSSSLRFACSGKASFRSGLAFPMYVVERSSYRQVGFKWLLHTSRHASPLMART